MHITTLRNVVRTMIGRSLFVASAMAATAGIAHAQSYPSQPIKIIVPFGPGGSSDIVGRVFGEYLQRLVKQPVVIENKAGANGIIGTDRKSVV